MRTLGPFGIFLDRTAIVFIGLKFPCLGAHFVRLAQDPKGKKIASKYRTPPALNNKAQNILPLTIIPNINLLLVDSTQLEQ